MELAFPVPVRFRPQRHPVVVGAVVVTPASGQALVFCVSLAAHSRRHPSLAPMFLRYSLRANQTIRLRHPHEARRATVRANLVFDAQTAQHTRLCVPSRTTCEANQFVGAENNGLVRWHSFRHSQALGAGPRWLGCHQRCKTGAFKASAIKKPAAKPPTTNRQPNRYPNVRCLLLSGEVAGFTDAPCAP